MKITHVHPALSIKNCIRYGKSQIITKKKNSRKRQQKKTRIFFSKISARQNHTPGSRAQLSAIFLCRQISRINLAKKSGNFFDKLKQ